MKKMKDSGIEWINLIPEDWELKKIKYTLKNRNENNNPIRSRDILSLTAKQGVIPLDEKEGGGNKPKEDFSAYKLTYPGDIVMNSMNILSGSVGLSKYFGCVSPVYYMLQPISSEDDVRYFNYIFQTTVFQKSLLGLGNGILMKESDNGKLNTIRMRIPLDKLGNLYIPVPDSKTQKQIAGFLDKIVPEIDVLLKDTEEEINILEEYKKSVITETVTKGLNPDTEMKDSGIEWVGNMPKHWKCNRGKYILKYIQKPVYEDDGVITCFRDGEVTLRSNRREDGFTMSEKEIGYQGIDVGDLVVHGMDGFAGAIGISDSRGKASPVLNVLETDQNKKYIMYYLRSMAYSDVFVALATGIRVRSCDLRWNKLAELPYPIPPIEEQDVIVKYIDGILDKTNAVISDKKAQLEILSEYKTSLIYEYVTGKKDVPTENDEEDNYDLNPILLGVIINKLGEHQTGRIQLQKILYLACIHLGLNHSAQYYRFNHGPYDINLNGYIDSLTKNHWFDEKREKSIVLVPGKRKEEFLDKYKEQLEDYNGKIVDLLNLLYRMNCLKRSRLERITTLYAVWNDLLLDGANPSDDEIINEVVTNWTDNKSNIQYSTWQDSLDKMKKYGLIPKGVGCHTISKPQKEALNDYE